jgi:delta1-piperideine-2-carboxylate reductase
MTGVTDSPGADAHVVVTVAEVHRVVREALLRAGCDAGNAEHTAAVMAMAERDGCPAHGVFRLPGHLASLASGKVNGRARPTLAPLAPAVVRVDGDRGFAPPAVDTARHALVPLARTQGLAAAAIADVFHFTALWADVEPLVEAGLVAFCCTAYMPSVAPAGASVPFFGTNAMAFGWPRPDGGTLVFDQASAAMAQGEIQIAARDGRRVPEGVGVDAAGQPTTDPEAILAGAQLPFGGHKGSAIALMVELLSAGLIGQPFSVEAGEEDNRDGGPPRGGVTIIALDPARFGDAPGWLAHSEAFLGRLAALPGVRLPGDRRLRERARIAREGVRLPVALWEKALRAGGR